MPDSTNGHSGPARLALPDRSRYVLAIVAFGLLSGLMALLPYLLGAHAIPLKLIWLVGLIGADLRSLEARFAQGRRSVRGGASHT